ncbi:MAG: hypothetical protein IPG80_06370 [Anaerolineales bacterium]|uniref:hypothetical protein n=1 Tax=Candidatus Villigracilis vicinus TaxID=3140679 RepID=UPI003135E366|nr:hypothetical protein [Anaerolineales bacterium]
MKEKIKQLLQKPFAIPAALSLLVLLAYGLLTPWMGFYWDDMPFAWFLHFFGPIEFIEAFRPFRPGLGYIFAATTAIFGGQPFTWQLLGLIIRLILGLQVWSLLRKVFPTRERSVLWVILLFTVYPAYGQQWVALTHINQELIPLFLLLSSFILTVSLLRSGKPSLPSTALAILLQALGLFTTEYFFGLEILRFFFILVIFAESIANKKDLIKKTFIQWLPYLIVWTINAAWTYSYHRSDAYNSYQISLLSLLSPLALLNEFVTTLSLSGFVSWLGTFSIFSPVDGSATQVIAFVIFTAACLVVYFLSGAQRNADSELPKANYESHNKDLPSSGTHYWFILIGIVTIFAGRLPSWAAGLPLKIEFDYDRFFVSIMLGASLFIIGLADLLLREGRAKLILLSLLIGISTAYQFTSANTYRRDWANMQDLFWQMAWRMPDLQEGTTVLTYELPLKYLSDYQLMSTLNWMYAPDFEGRELPYALQYLKTRFEAAEIKADHPIEVTYRTVKFSGNTSNSVVIYKEADGCLRVLDPVYNNAETVPGASFYLTDAIALSDPALIRTDASTPAMEKKLFGNEPSHGWCYTYAQAELARQAGNWEDVAAIYKNAQKEELAPTLPVEYLPFIEAFVHTGDMDTALKLTEKTIKSQPTLCPALNTMWTRVSGTVDISEAETLLQKECKP